jgi:hypothetical protein
MPVVRTVLVWAMLAMVPLTSVRIVCITEGPRATKAGQPGDALDCVTLCSRHPQPHVKTRCILVEDPSCAFALGSAIAIVPQPPVLTHTRTHVSLDAAPTPVLPFTFPDPHSPPPKR